MILQDRCLNKAVGVFVNSGARQGEQKADEDSTSSFSAVVLNLSSLKILFIYLSVMKGLVNVHIDWLS